MSWKDKPSRIKICDNNLIVKNGASSNTYYNLK